MIPPKKPLPKKTIKKADKKMSAGTIAAWAFVALALAGIVLLVINAPRQGNLVCSGGGSSLIGFGNCHTE